MMAKETNDCMQSERTYCSHCWKQQYMNYVTLEHIYLLMTMLFFSTCRRHCLSNSSTMVLELSSRRVRQMSASVSSRL